ncbi:MAG: hypothetical protein PHV34_06420 [Verrucomicrobiae bacterium]|nr:hypothetical protein [Verrucomicrobiae bacterium]
MKTATSQVKNGSAIFHRRSYGPLAFWFLNHRLEKDELARQLDEMKDRGFSGVFMHPRPGLLIPYGSKDWFEMTGFIIEQAKRRGMEAWLYDEDPWPSGMAGGRVTLEHPEWRASSLQYKILKIDRPGHYELDLPEGLLIAAHLIDRRGMLRVDECAGLARTEWGRPWLNSNGYYPPYTDGNPHWRATNGQTHFRLAIDVRRAPATLIGFVRQYVHNGFWGEYVDLLNPAPVERFIELTHREYQRRFGREFGRAIPGIFTDEPKVNGALPWSEHLEPYFHAITGKGLRDCLPHLAMDWNDDDPYFRWAFREANSQAFKAAFIDPIENFCRKSGIVFTGHISPEEDPIGQARMTPGLMNWVGDMGLPGTDIIGSNIGDRLHPLLHLGPKLVSSAAHTRGKTHVLCEAFAVGDWSQDLSAMGRTVNWLYALGVNMLTVHGQFYSIDGLRKREAAPSQFYQASYWEHFGAFSGYVGNLSRELTRGHHEAPILLYYPAEAFMALSSAPDCGEGEKPASWHEADRLRSRLAMLMDELLTHGCDFDLIDAQGLMNAKADKRGIEVDREMYEALVLPGGWIRKDVSAKLLQLQEEGAMILAVEKKLPVLGGGWHRAPAFADLGRVSGWLKSRVQPLFEVGGRLMGHQRAYPGGRSIFLVNNDEKPFDGPVKLHFEGPYEIFDPQTGKSRQAPDPLRLELKPWRGVVIRQTQKAGGIRVMEKQPDWRPWVDLTRDWIARPEGDNCLILSEFRVKTAGDPVAALKIPPEQWGGAPMVDLLSPQADQVKQFLGRTTVFCAVFDSHGYHGPLSLVRDSQLGPSGERDAADGFVFSLNGRNVAGFQRTRRFDSFNMEARLDHLVREGRNWLLMARQLSGDAPVLDCLPYDAIRLFGAFEVDFPYGRECPAALRPRPDFRRLAYPVSPLEMGHPQYGGIYIYEHELRLDRVPSQLAIGFEKLHESAAIRVNGKDAGVLWQEPHRLEFPAALFRRGANRIEIRCSTSPANYLQGLRRPSGFTGAVTLFAGDDSKDDGKKMALNSK